jgi:ankyrin repeat protein
VDHGADISQYSQFAAEVEFLWNPCSLVEGQDEECIETTKDGIINKISVRMNNNVKTQTVEELRQLKKSLHLNAFKYILNEIESDLFALTQARFVKSRAEDDLSVAKDGASTEGPESKSSAISKLNESILEDCRRRYDKHVVKNPEEFIQDEKYRGLVREMMDTKAMAISKLRLWLEDPSQQWAEVLRMPLRIAHRTLVGFLETGIAEAGEETMQASYELCKMKDLITVSVDELNDLEEPVIIQASAEGADEGTLKLLVNAGADVNAQDKLGWTAVMKAAFAGHMQTLEALLKFKNPSAKVKTKNFVGETAVMLAAQNGHLDLIEKLVSCNAEIDVKDIQKSSVLMRAARFGHENVVKYLLEKNGALIKDFNETNMTPVMMAAQGGQTSLVLYLQDRLDQYGCGINFKDLTGRTALFYASGGGHLDIIQAVVNRDADIYARDNKEMTPIMVAASSGKTEAVIYLQEVHRTRLDKKPKPENKFATEDEILQLLKDTDTRGLTAVVHAASHSKADCVEALVKLKADVTTGLHSLCKFIKSDLKDSPWIRAVMVLVDNDAGINTMIDGITALEVSKNIHVREILQRKGADGWTDILMAAEQGDEAQIEHLKSKIAVENNHGESALQIAAQHGHTKVVELLIQLLTASQADINKEDKSGKTALHAAAKSGNIGTVKALILAKAKVNHKDKMKNSALSYADDKCCRYLMKMMGADNWSPLMVSAEQGTHQVLQYLKLREIILCSSMQTSSMPEWFQEEERFYSSLVKQESKWTWGLFDSKTRTLEKDRRVFLKKEQMLDSCSCVLGSMALGEGVHRWTLLLKNVSMTWAGIVHGIDEEQILGWQPSNAPSACCEYMIVIDQKGALICSTKSANETRKVPFIEYIIPCVGFLSDQTLGFELDSFKKTLKIEVDNMLVAVIHNIDITQQVSPYVCTNKSETVELLSCVSWVRESEERVVVTNDRLNMMKILLGRVTREPVMSIITQHIISGSDINEKNEEQCTALHIAAGAGNAAVVRTLLAAKAKLDGHMEGNSSCLHFAASFGDTATILELLHSKAPVDARDVVQCTPLHKAASAGKQDAIRLLITFKANFNTKNTDDLTPLEACRQLKSYDVDGVLSQMDDGWTPLMLAISEGGDSNINRIRTLILEGEDVDKKNKMLQTSLHIASEKGHFEAIKALLAGKGSIEVRDRNNSTPLHLAAAAGRENAVLALVRAKADVNASNKQCHTALDETASDDCSLLLQMAGTKGWTPLMVAVKTGNLRECFGVRELICCMKEMRHFPHWFIEDAIYYLNLSVCPSGWTWDQQDIQAGLNLSGDKRTASHQFSSAYTYVLGSEDFKDGVHTWEIKADNVGSMWVGIGRNVDAQNLLGQSGLQCPDSCTLAFPSYGESVLRLGHKTAACRVTKILSGFKSGDRIKLELDLHKKHLKMCINGVTAFAVSGVDGAGTRPLVVMDRGSVALVSMSQARLLSTDPLISSEEQKKGFDNSKWIWNPTAFDILASASGNIHNGPSLFFISSKSCAHNFLLFEFPGNIDSAIKKKLSDAIKLSLKSDEQACTQGILEARSKILAYVSHMLRNLAADHCVGDCMRLLRDMEDINSPSQDKMTALHVAAQLGLLDSVRLLLMHKANVALQDKVCETPATKAKTMRHVACYRLLKCMENSMGNDSLQQAENVNEVQIVDTDGDMVRFCLSEDGKHIELSVNGEIIINQVTDIQVDDSTGRVSLENGGFRIKDEDRNAKLSKLRALFSSIGNQIPTEERASEDDDSDWSLLMVAADAGDVQQIESMLTANADINACSKRKRTALHVAANAGNRSAVTALIGKNASIEAKDVDDQTPLHVAAKRGFADLLPLLMQGKAEVLGFRDLKGFTALHYAATASGEAVRLLVRSNANPDEKGPLQRTALHLAAESNRIDCLSALLELKANISETDESARSALDMCSSDGCRYVLKMYGAEGWTPLMAACVASRWGGDELRQYALENSALTACFHSVPAKEFPSWFQDDVLFYTKLDADSQKWSWGVLESKLAKSSDGMRISKAPDSSGYSCALGSEVLKAGVHEWVLKVDSVQSMWVGISRGVSESKLLASYPNRPGEDGCIVAFHSSDCFRPIVYGSKQSKIRSIPDSRYGSGDQLTLQLDTNRHILRLKINDTVAVVVSNVDDVDVRPYVCTECMESISLVGQVSHTFNTSNTAENAISGLDNTIWSLETDACLNALLLEGSYLYVSCTHDFPQFCYCIIYMISFFC